MALFNLNAHHNLTDEKAKILEQAIKIRERLHRQREIDFASENGRRWHSIRDWVLQQLNEKKWTLNQLFSYAGITSDFERACRTYFRKPTSLEEDMEFTSLMCLPYDDASGLKVIEKLEKARGQWKEWKKTDAIYDAWYNGIGINNGVPLIKSVQENFNLSYVHLSVDGDAKNMSIEVKPYNANQVPEIILLVQPNLTSDIQVKVCEAILF